RVGGAGDGGGRGGTGAGQGDGGDGVAVDEAAGREGAGAQGERRPVGLRLVRGRDRERLRGDGQAAVDVADRVVAQPAAARRRGDLRVGGAGDGGGRGGAGAGQGDGGDGVAVDEARAAELAADEADR